MTKPHEEEWVYDRDWPEYVAIKGGANIARFSTTWMRDPELHDEARARLASKAPMTADDIIGTGLETVEIPMKQFAALVEALREAGVLE